MSDKAKISEFVNNGVGTVAAMAPSLVNSAVQNVGANRARNSLEEAAYQGTTDELLNFGADKARFNALNQQIDNTNFYSDARTGDQLNNDISTQMSTLKEMQQGLRPMSAGQKWANFGSKAAQGAALGASIGSIFPGMGTAIGAAAGTVVGGVVGLMNQGKQRRIARANVKAQNAANRMSAGMENAANNLDNYNINNMGYNMFAEGGFTGMPTQALADEAVSAPTTEFTQGGTHEENPYGGIPIGMAPDGKPNLVEEGEIRLNNSNYILSDRLKIDKDDAIAMRLPKKFIGKTFAEAFKLRTETFEKTENDPITKKGLAAEEERFKQGQERAKQKMQAKQQQYKITHFDPSMLPPQEVPPVQMPQVQAPATAEPTVPMPQPQMPQPAPQGQMSPQEMAEQGMMAYGGHLFNDGGTPDNTTGFSKEQLQKGYLETLKQLYGLQGRDKKQTSVWKDAAANWNRENIGVPGTPEYQTIARGNQLLASSSPMYDSELANKESTKAINWDDRDIMNTYLNDSNFNAAQAIFDPVGLIKSEIGKKLLILPTPTVTEKNLRPISPVQNEVKGKDEKNGQFLKFKNGEEGLGANWSIPIAGLGLMRAYKPADYSHANRIENLPNSLRNASYTPLNNYQTAKYIDQQYLDAQAASESQAAIRALNQAGAASPSSAANLLAQNYNNQIARGQGRIQANMANNAEDQRIADFNRATDQANAQMFQQNSQYNIGQYNQALMQTGLAANQMRFQQDQARDANIDASWGSMADVLQRHRSDVMKYNMIKNNTALIYDPVARQYKYIDLPQTNTNTNTGTNTNTSQTNNTNTATAAAQTGGVNTTSTTPQGTDLPDLKEYSSDKYKLN